MAPAIPQRPPACASVLRRAWPCAFRRERVRRARMMRLVASILLSAGLATASCKKSDERRVSGPLRLAARYQCDLPGERQFIYLDRDGHPSVKPGGVWREDLQLREVGDHRHRSRMFHHAGLVPFCLVPTTSRWRARPESVSRKSGHRTVQSSSSLPGDFTCIGDSSNAGVGRTW
jgi:hypothetical protein